jgi:hypothetical protein
LRVGKVKVSRGTAIAVCSDRPSARTDPIAV